MDFDGDESAFQEQVENFCNGKDREKFRELKKRLKESKDKFKKNGMQPEKGMRYEYFDCQKYDFELYAREEWGAVSSLFQDFWSELMCDVMVTYTDTRRCDGFNDCSLLLKELQRRHMASGEPDIKPNFMISDGFVFEGRGWHTKPPRLERWPDVADRCLEFAIIGPRGHFPKKLEQETALELAEFGRRNFCLQEKVGVGLDYFDLNQPMTDELQKYINTPPEQRP